MTSPTTCCIIFRIINGAIRNVHKLWLHNHVIKSGSRVWRGAHGSGPLRPFRTELPSNLKRRLLRSKNSSTGFPGKCVGGSSPVPAGIQKSVSSARRWGVRRQDGHLGAHGAVTWGGPAGRGRAARLIGLGKVIAETAAGPPDSSVRAASARAPNHSAAVSDGSGFGCGYANRTSRGPPRMKYAPMRMLTSRAIKARFCGAGFLTKLRTM
jgi:hypothetical protein